MLIFKVTWRTQCDSHSVQYPHAGWGAGNRKHASGCRHPTQRASLALRILPLAHGQCASGSVFRRKRRPQRNVLRHERPGIE